MRTQQRTRGLVLRTRLFSETSLIVNWVTRDFGRLDTMAKGARRPKSPLRGKLDLFFELELSFVASQRSTLHTLVEASLCQTHAALRTELLWLRQASYAGALIAQTTEPGTPIPELYELMLGFLQYLPHQRTPALTLFAFEMKCLEELGLRPPLETTGLTAGARQLLESAARFQWDQLPRLQGTTAQLGEIARYLHGFLIYHLDRLPPGRSGALGEGG